MSTGSIAAKGRRAGKSPWVEGLGRAGLAAKGVLYVVIGLLAIQVALGARGEKADTQGALSEIAQKPFGRLLLVVLASGSRLTRSGAWRRRSSTGTTRAREQRGSRSVAAPSLGQSGTAGSAC